MRNHNKPKKPLTVALQTLRVLDARELTQIGGGEESENSCYPCGSDGCVTKVKH